jgi:SAM-dependent methyltransferase
MSEGQHSQEEFSKSPRVRTTIRELVKLAGEDVVELGSSDFSFKTSLLQTHHRTYRSWKTIDLGPTADFNVDLNVSRLHLPLGDQTVDVAICTEVLEHLLWPQALLLELRRILRPHGVLICSVPNIVSLTYRIKFLFGGLPSCSARGNVPARLNEIHYFNEQGLQHGGHVINFNKGMLRDLLELCGFVCKRMLGTGLFWHRTILPAAFCPVSLSSNLLAIASVGPTKIESKAPDG